MKPKRVDCQQCQNFINVTFKDEGNLLSKIDTRAKCKIGKRVMFRMPDMGFGGYPFDICGYFRYCNDFKQTVDEEVISISEAPLILNKSSINYDKMRKRLIN